MRNYPFLLAFIMCSFFGFAHANSDALNVYTLSDSTQLNSKAAVAVLFEKGSEEYNQHHYNKAISLWKEVLKKTSKEKGNQEIGFKARVNIGAAYNAIGYHKTASQYFIEVKNNSKADKKNEMYWINNLNIGVCYMSLEQYDAAKQFFDQTEDFNPYVTFLKNLNLAKWYGLKDNHDKFYEFQTIVSKQIVRFSMYESIWEEMQLEFFMKWKEVEKIKKVVATLIPQYALKNSYLKLLINQALLDAGLQPAEPLKAVLLNEQEIKDSNDFYLKSAYYKLVKAFYYQAKNLERYHAYDTLWIENNELLATEKNMLYVEDFKAAHEIEAVKNKYTQIQLEKEVVEIKLTKSKIRFQLSVVIIIFCVVFLLFILRNYRKNKKIQTLKFIQSQSIISKKEGEKLVLTENLKEKSEELTTSILNIKKVALLKKQLEKIVDDKDPSADEKDTLKQLKVCLNSFFDNYRELNLLMQKKLNVDKIVAFITKELPEITPKEIEIIEYIMLQFTTKEIAILMDKSEKSIEYYRAQIRKKINVSNDQTIEEFFNSL